MIAAIIQARTGSTRLPCKVLHEIWEKPMLQRVIERVKMAKSLEEVILAIPDRSRDEVMVQLGVEWGIPVFCGSEDDVLDRYYRCAERFGIETVVRITSDCPLIDPGLIDRTVAYAQKRKRGYTALTWLPDGLDVEVMGLSSLWQAWEMAKSPYEREHVGPWFRRSYEIALYRETREDFGYLHWSVDTMEDLEFARYVYHELGDNFTYKDVFALLDRVKKEGKVEHHFGGGPKRF